MMGQVSGQAGAAREDGSPYPVVLIRGDGIGPELADATRTVLDATGVPFDWREVDAGESVMAKHGTPLPQEVIDAIRETGVAIKAPITTPVGKGFRSVNVALRQELRLFSCVRPCKIYEGVRTRFSDVDIVIVRENTEDLYAGIEFERGTEEVAELIDWIRARRPKANLHIDSGISIKPISVAGSERIMRYAFEYARQNGRKLVTAVHKANIMKFSDGLFLEVARNVAKEYSDIEFSDRIVDNMCMQMVQHPEEYDVLVLPNLYGDIVSDLAAGMIGGLGLAPGGNIGEEGAVFEATHGSAPDIAGMDKANPCAMVLSGMLMLRHLGEMQAADRLEAAVAHVLAEGRRVTADLKQDRNDPTAVGTKEMTRAIVEHIEQSK